MSMLAPIPPSGFFSVWASFWSFVGSPSISGLLSDWNAKDPHSRQNILAKLPAPVVISDAAGYIIYANEALCSGFKQKSTELTGKRYVDYLMTDIQEGKAMRYYIELFGAEANSIHDVEIKPFDSQSTLKARLTCLGTGPIA